MSKTVSGKNPETLSAYILQWGGSRTELGHSMQVQGKRILVAEDNVALAHVVRFHLERAGFCVTIARNGREAWDFLQIGSFDLLVTDQQMPEVSGCDLCKSMRQDHRFSGMPIVMLTAKGLEIEQQWLREELGVRQVLPKPFSVIQLTETIVDCLSATSAPRG
jgi:CheY-like chemotaxis protein